MKERPVLFNAEMVRAIIDGRKTQTRRVMRVQPGSPELGLSRITEAKNSSDTGKYFWSLSDALGSRPRSKLFPCPFGQLGDRLWVRETFGDCGSRLVYRADSSDGAACSVKRWVPSIHMPRSACRLLLEITDVRVERLNAISHEDAEREGIHTEVWDQTVVARNYAAEDEFFQFWSESMAHYVDMHELYRASFQSLWQSIYGTESWQANPFVWVITFKRVEVDE